jgi:hypothetical protein
MWYYFLSFVYFINMHGVGFESCRDVHWVSNFLPGWRFPSVSVNHVSAEEMVVRKLLHQNNCPVVTTTALRVLRKFRGCYSNTDRATDSAINTRLLQSNLGLPKTRNVLGCYSNANSYRHYASVWLYMRGNNQRDAHFTSSICFN